MNSIFKISKKSEKNQKKIRKKSEKKGIYNMCIIYIIWGSGQ